MSLVYAGIRPAQCLQRAHHHFGMLVAIKDLGRADDAKVDIALVVKDGAAAGAPPDELHWGVCVASRGECREVCLDPRVLVAAKDDAGCVGVEEENGGVGGRGLQQMVFDGEVEEGVAGAGEVDLNFVGG